jgi:hypothetical protein
VSKAPTIPAYLSAQAYYIRPELSVYLGFSFGFLSVYVLFPAAAPGKRFV